MAPRQFFLVACAAFLALSLGSLGLALHQPWLGVQLVGDADGALRVAAVSPRGPAQGVLHPGDVLRTLHLEGDRQVALSAAWLRVNPGTLPTYAAYDAFLADLRALHAQAVRGHLRLGLADGREVTVVPLAARPLREAPAAWLLWLLRIAVVMILVCGLLAFLPRDRGLLGIALAGAASAGTSFALLPLEAREWVIDPALMEVLHRSLWLTHAFYGCGLAVALWHTPQRLRASRLAWLLYPIYGLAWLAYFARVFDDPLRLQAAVSLSGLLVVAGLLVAQWRASAPRSAARRGVLWFCACIGGSLLWFTAFLFLPMSLREDPVFSTEWIEIGVFLSFVGLAAGIYRERLFRADRWLLRAWLLLLATFCTIALDLALVLALDVDSLASLLVAAALVAWIYLPLRQSVWLRLWRDDDAVRAQQVQLAALRAALPGPDAPPLAQRWRVLLTEVFDPLHVEPDPDATSQDALLDDGQVLLLAAPDDSPPLRLAHAGGGVRRFDARDLTRAALFRRWMLEGEQRRHAWRDGAAAERARFAADLHDDAVPPLLSLLYRSRDLDFHDALRELMPRLRATIRALAGSEGVQR